MVNLIFTWKISFLFHCSAFVTIYMLRILLLRRSVWCLFMKVRVSESASSVHKICYKELRRLCPNGLVFILYDIIRT
jgi:hypothetical protein